MYTCPTCGEVFESYDDAREHDRVRIRNRAACVPPPRISPELAMKIANKLLDYLEGPQRATSDALRDIILEVGNARG